MGIEVTQNGEERFWFGPYVEVKWTDPQESFSFGVNPREGIIEARVTDKGVTLYNQDKRIPLVGGATYGPDGLRFGPDPPRTDINNLKTDYAGKSVPYLVKNERENQWVVKPAGSDVGRVRGPDYIPEKEMVDSFDDLFR